VNPEDFDDINNFIDMDKIMNRAEKAFTDIVNKNYPYLRVPLVDNLYKLTEWYENYNLPSEIKLDLPDPQLFDL